MKNTNIAVISTQTVSAMIFKSPTVGGAGAAGAAGSAGAVVPTLSGGAVSPSAATVSPDMAQKKDNVASKHKLVKPLPNFIAATSYSKFFQSALDCASAGLPGANTNHVQEFGHEYLSVPDLPRFRRPHDRLDYLLQVVVGNDNF